MKNVEELSAVDADYKTVVSNVLGDMSAMADAAWLTLETALCDMQAQIQDLETTFEARVIEAVKNAQRDRRL